MQDRELKSDILLEVQFHTKVPTKLEYDIEFKIQYSVYKNKWVEKGLKNPLNRSNTANFEYSYQADKQEIMVDIVAS
jgi:hypothetical protein